MKALVVVESMFGNSRAVALAVAEGLGSVMDVDVVDVVDVGRAPTRLEVDLVVVGGPTHAFSMTRPGTREDALRRGARADLSAGVGVREWLETVCEVAGEIAASAFDTRIHRPHVPGSAAKAMHSRLARRGYVMVDGPQSFWVEGTEGPLVPGETERAREWGARLGRAVTGHPRPRRSMPV